MEKTKYKYRLGYYKEVGKVVCPYCGKKEFVRLVETATGKIVEGFGRCDRDTCPSRSISDGGVVYPDKPIDTSKFKTVKKDEKPKVFYDPEIVKEYAENRTENALCRYLLQKAGDKERFENVLKMYRVGSVNDGIIFWQIDGSQNVRRGKVMFYDENGHRKKTAGGITSMWKILNRDKDNEPEMCCFGQHLVGLLPVAIVESEKTALVASYAMPELTWIATSSISNFNTNRLQFLNGFKKPVIVFPDYDGYDKWAEQTEFFKAATKLNISVDDTIKQYGSGKQDLADLFLS